MPAIMHRTDPPAISMVGTGSATMRAERSMMARCASVRLAAARSDIANNRPPSPDNSIACRQFPNLPGLQRDDLAA